MSVVGSVTSILPGRLKVRFAPLSDRRADIGIWQLRANDGHLRCSLSWTKGGNIGLRTARGGRMSDTQFDQKAWLERIGHSGAVTPTLETLNRLIFAHSHSISYETLDIMLGRPPKLDVPTLQR